MVKRTRRPTHPGEILKEEFLIPLGLTQKKLADHLGVDIKVINRIINKKSGITPKMAVKLGHVFSTSPNFWLNAQNSVDLYEAEKSESGLPKKLVS